LQLELVRFGSPNFNFNKVGIENLQPFIDILMNVLLQSERKYIIFCGSVFEELFAHCPRKTHTFYLTKKDGSRSAREYRVTNVKMQHHNQEIIACIAPHYAIQGIPADKYGEKVCHLYGKF